MALEIRQSLKLSQQPIMTPQLQQAIKLLQLSRMELIDVIRQEQEENPVLEETVEAEESASAEGVEEAPKSTAEEGNEAAGPDRDFPPAEWGTTRYGTASKDGDEEDDRPTFENFLTKKTTLADHLLWQLRLNDFTEEECFIGSLIIGNLNEDGLLQITVDEIAVQSGAEPAQVEKVLQRIQAFDPPGIAGRDLKECLLIQAGQICPGETVVQKILCDYLDHLAKRNYHGVAKELGIPLEEVARATHIINELNPRPGRAFSDETIPYIVPDVYVYKIGDDYVIMLNEDGLPKLRINPYYKGILREQARAVDAKDYINEKMRSALWLIKSIHQRQRTIYRVTKSIVKFQREFLDKGVAFLKPMVLKDVAQDVEMHESTISRVTSNKYVHTPQGIFELKYFFNSSINTSRGENIASESVKEKIREILAKEDSQKPYSDQEIVEILKKQDILIARRTVTKYREILGVLPSTRRRQII